MGLSPIFIDLNGASSSFSLAAKVLSELDSCTTFNVCCANLEIRLRLGNEVRRPKIKIEGAEVKYSNKFNFIEYLPRSIKKTQVLS